jgi:hypothetical protein
MFVDDRMPLHQGNIRLAVCILRRRHHRFHKIVKSTGVGPWAVALDRFSRPGRINVRPLLGGRESQCQLLKGDVGQEGVILADCYCKRSFSRGIQVACGGLPGGAGFADPDGARCVATSVSPVLQKRSKPSAAANAVDQMLQSLILNTSAIRSDGGKTVEDGCDDITRHRIRHTAPRDQQWNFGRTSVAAELRSLREQGSVGTSVAGVPQAASTMLATINGEKYDQFVTHLFLLLLYLYL